MISQEKGYILTPLQKLIKNVGDLAKLILPRALKTCPKFNKSPNLVTPVESQKARRKIKIYNLECFIVNYNMRHYVLWLFDYPEGKDHHCTAGLRFNWIVFGQIRQYAEICMY